MKRTDINTKLVPHNSAGDGAESVVLKVQGAQQQAA